ncbi:MAG: hypothetical protein P8185_19980, partial [Deltaproteobacteria bacterium]
SDPGACQRLKACVDKYNLSDAVRVYPKNFFDLDPRELSDQTGIICINPPYGRRLGAKQESEKIFAAICDKLKLSYKGWNLALFAPSRKLAIMVPFQTKSYPVLHGGLKLALMVGKIQ